MKRCPNCNQMFEDENSFCLNDGTVLELLNHSLGNNIPTQVFASFPTKTIEKKDANKSFYAIIGTMAVVIIGLSAIVFFLMSGKNDLSNKNRKENQTIENKQTQTEVNKTQTAPTIKQENQFIAENTPMQVQPLTSEAVRNLINRWEKAQDAQNFRIYQSCYGQPFAGVKRANGATKNYNYASWMNDRGNILRNAVNLDIEIQNLQITIEGDTATAEFNQYYRSLKYNDWGPKVLKLKMFPDGAKIVYEELKASYPLN